MNKTGTQQIRTERLILRPFLLSDSEDMYRNWASDPEVTKYLTWPVHSSAEVTRMLLQNWISHYQDGDFFNWAIEWKNDGKVIGNISVVRLAEAIDEAEIGYCMCKRFWGQGIMAEALRAIEAYLFETVGMNRIVAVHDANNPRSGRVMDKAGMRQEGTMRQGGKNNQGICDAVKHAILHSDWLKMKEAERYEPARNPAEIRHAASSDWAFWSSLDHQLPQEQFIHKMEDKLCYVLTVAGEPAGILRWSLFWDTIPFCNLLYVKEEQQKKGYGRKLMEHWEAEMLGSGYDLVMTSTQADEQAQHFYRALGYKDCGGLTLPFPGYEQPTELILAKSLMKGA